MNGIHVESEEGMITCQFCKKPTPLEYNFCIECDSQIKCIECSKKTFPGKDYCLACAKPLLIKSATSQAPNQYERSVEQDGDKYKEHTRFALSDNAVHEIAPFVVSQTMPGIKIRSNAPIPPASLSNSQPEDTSYEDLTSQDDAQKNVEQNTDRSSNASNEFQPNASQNSLSQLFQCDGTLLVATTNDFKGQNWSEQQRNFILLFTKAYKDSFNKPVPDKETIKKAGEKLKIIDPNNFKNYLNKTVTAFMTLMTNGLVLNTPGEKEVAKILKLMENESSKPGYAYWSRSGSNPTTASRLDKDDKERVASWINDSVDLGKLDIRDIKVARDYALLSLWIIIHHLKKSDSVKWNEAMLYLTSKYATTSVNGQAFSKAVTAKENEKYFTKSGEGSYYLSTDGQKTVEDWISGKISVKKQAK